MQRVDVLQNVGLQVGDQDHVEFVEGLVYVAHIVLFARRVLGSAIGELGEGCEEGFDA